ncbi:hypothetical protein Mal4_50320 [Maioricimonas rarisocia]|uniref:DUF434 domain-containing protein n=1 Tax=Maioricimonas rarisocia TaxID=2528026 RepID=A0A517ZDY8_9PLAN|nr:DUF434 domain-containing protein [Maioricimonas rarisocia]QDU40674.1 hypothetical protein Mal4_50320 [Maioricimonas rarisocia]
MPDRRQHRGPHPHDTRLFGVEFHAVLRTAVDDLSWLLSRGYAEPSSLKIVGDRYKLNERQRTAVIRSASRDDARTDRATREVRPDQLYDQTLEIDGFNLLTTIEAALSGGVLLLGRDGCLRDMASMHGSYRKVAETGPALERIGDWLTRHQIAHAHWWLDRPVSNSGRLKGIMAEMAAANDWPWTMELDDDPDRRLAGSDKIVASADSMILDRCRRWCNLARHIVEETVADTWIVDLRDGPAGG